VRSIVASLILAVLLFGSQVWAAYTESGGGSQRATYAGTTGEDTGVLPYPGSTTAGCLLVAGGTAWDTTVPSGVTVTDTQTNSWIVFTTNSGGSPLHALEYIAYAIAGASSANTLTVDPTGSTTAFISYGIDQFCGNSAAPVIDVNGGNTAYPVGSETTTPSDGITTGVANALVLGVLGTPCSSCSTITEDTGSGYTKIGEYDTDSSAENFSFIFRIVTSAGAYTPNWVIGGAAQVGNAMTASFKPQPPPTGTIAVVSTPVSGGATVSGNVDVDANGTTTDWVGINTTACGLAGFTGEWNYLSNSHTPPGAPVTTPVQIDLTAPVTPGTYLLCLYIEGTYTGVMDSDTFAVQAPGLLKGFTIGAGATFTIGAGSTFSIGE
jgi:hypothetical protein